MEVVVVGARECESNEDARSLGPRRQLSGEPLEHRPRASAVPGLEVVVGGVSTPAANVLAKVGRREARGLLGELGGRPGRAAHGSSARRRLEPVCHRRIGAGRGEREVARPLLGIAYELSEAAVERTLALRPSVGGCGEERVDEANAVSVELHDLRIDGGLERTAVAGCGRNECECWLGEGRSSAEGSDRLGRKRGEPAACELVHVLGHRQALACVEGPAAALERAGKLEREEWIATRSLVDTAQCRAGKDGVEPIAEKPVERTQAERPDRNAAQPLLWEGSLEAQRRVRSASSCSQESDRLVLEPAERKLQRCCGSTIEPLKVVNGKQQRLGRGEFPQCAKEADADGPPIGRRSVWLHEKEGDLERVRLWPGEGAEDILEPLLEQVADRREGKTRLDLHWAGGENADP